MDAVIVGIADNAIRARLFACLHALLVPFVSAVHPRAVVARGVSMGRGVAVMAGAVVIKDLEDGVTVVGVPAQVVKSRARVCS